MGRVALVTGGRIASPPRGGAGIPQASTVPFFDDTVYAVGNAANITGTPTEGANGFTLFEYTTLTGAQDASTGVYWQFDISDTDGLVIPTGPVQKYRWEYSIEADRAVPQDLVVWCAVKNGNAAVHATTDEGFGTALVGLAAGEVTARPLTSRAGWILTATQYAAQASDPSIRFSHGGLSGADNSGGIEGYIGNWAVGRARADSEAVPGPILTAATYPVEQGGQPSDTFNTFVVGAYTLASLGAAETIGLRARLRAVRYLSPTHGLAASGF